jgi:EH_Signature domain
MSYRDALSALISASLGNSTGALRQNPLQKARKGIEEVFTRAGASPDGFELERLYKKLFAIVSADAGWEQITQSDWRNSAYLLSRNGWELAKNINFKSRYAPFLMASRLTRPLKALIFVYFRDFNMAEPSVRWIALLIRDNLGGSGDGTTQVWSARHNQYQVFDPSTGPSRVADLILKSSQTPMEVLCELGLDGTLATAGFVTVAYDAALTAVSSELRSRRTGTALLSRLLSWSGQNSELTFPERRVAIVHALMSPWRDGSDPEENVRLLIIKFLERRLGDPRIRREKWIGVDGWAVKILLRWLTRETVRQFFQIIDQDALDAHWKWRRRFWMAYYERGVLDEAWLALGPSAQRSVSFSLPDGHLKAGRLNGGSDNNQSVLIMRVRHLTIVERSHNGKCRIWVNAKQAPRLYLEKYNSWDLTRGDAILASSYNSTGIAHTQSQTGYWQRRIAEFIAAETGIRVRHDEYMADI